MEGSMAKVTVDIPLERLSMAQEYDIDLSDACTRAIERELRERAPLMNLTPVARSLLFRAQREAETREHATIRTEHIVLAILADDSIPGQLMRRLGIAQPLADAREETMRSVGYHTPSNRVADKNANPLGCMYLNANGHPYVGDSEGKPIRVPCAPTGEGTTEPAA